MLKLMESIQMKCSRGHTEMYSKRKPEKHTMPQKLNKHESSALESVEAIENKLRKLTENYSGKHKYHQQGMRKVKHKEHQRSFGLQK